MRSGILVSILAVVATLAVAGPARAQSGDVPCNFSDQATYDALAAAGANGSLVAHGGADVAGLAPYYETTYTVDVGIWIDDAFLATTTDAAALALRYFEHANCVFGAGRNAVTGTGVNQTSLRLAGNRIRFYNHTTPNAPGSTAPWGQQYNWDWAQAMAGTGAPTVNFLFTTNMAGDPTGSPATYPVLVFGGAANGIGQGNAIIAVDSTWFADGMSWLGVIRNQAEDWWGLIAAHELGHALGGVHLAQQYDTMCCSGTDYPASAKGTTASENYAVASSTWNLITANDVSDTDTYTDPYSSTPNPVTNVTWNFDDISNFLFPRAGGDVFVAPSTGSSFQARTLRHDWFCINDEVCLTGDFNGDGRQDLVAFTRGATGDVFVALATANGGFAGTGVLWHDQFALNAETPLVGDFNGDGRDDIASFTGGTAADVYVALSTGYSFSGTGRKWHNYFAPTGEPPLVGDFNGDGRDDIAGLTRGTTGDVYVALSTGSGFGARTKWHDFFCINSELPFAADVNHDGKDDIVSFARGSLGNVYVARSNGSAFVGTNSIWTTNLCLGTDVCGLADVTGDGRADALAFDRSE